MNIFPISLIPSFRVDSRIASVQAEFLPSARSDSSRFDTVGSLCRFFCHYLADVQLLMDRNSLRIIPYILITPELK